MLDVGKNRLVIFTDIWHLASDIYLFVTLAPSKS